MLSRNQEHVLQWWPELDSTQRQQLLDDIESVPWDLVDQLVESHVRRKPVVEIPKKLEPAKAYNKPTLETAKDRTYQQAMSLGSELIAAGKVAAFTVAGGQGTRLGFDGPKGAVPITPVRKKSFFQLFSEMICAASRKHAVPIPWYIMTSAANHNQTIAFFKSHKYFGLPESEVIFFRQGMLPSFNFDGKVLLAERHRPALSPDGHGGSFKALNESGSARHMQSRGVEIISYFQIDNPLVQPFDELFIGLHRLDRSEMSTKVAAKNDDFERVGNVCLNNGHVSVVEYSDLPAELARARNADGSRMFNLGSLGMHLVEVGFVERIGTEKFGLPFHRAEKSIPCVDNCGNLVAPEKGSPNCVKLETFVFDALPRAESAMLLEIDRADEFSPVKNATGIDSLDSARVDLMRRNVRWLESIGVTVPYHPDGSPGAIIEVAPSFAMSPADLESARGRLTSINPGDVVYLS